MIAAFYDYKRSTPRSGNMDQWQLVLDLLYKKFQGWKVGEVSHLEMNQAILKTPEGCRKVYIACLQASATS